MGGRGAWSYISNEIVNRTRAVIRRSRVSDYLLNPKKSKGKDKFLRSLGYNMRNQARLQKDLRDGLKGNRARVSEPNAHGTVHIQVNMEIGLNKKAMVVTGWILKEGSKTPELSTVRPFKPRKDRF